MADLTVTNTEYGPLAQLPLAEDLVGLEELVARKKALARAMAAAPMPGITTYGRNINVLPGWGEVLSNAAKRGLAPQLEDEASRLQVELQRRMSQGERQFLRNLPTDRPLTGADLAAGYAIPSLRKDLSRAFENVVQEPFEVQKAERVARAKAADTAAGNLEWDRRNAITSDQALTRARVIAGIQEANKPTTESEKKAVGYYDRMVAAEKTIESLGAAGDPSLTTEIAGGIPKVGGYAQRIAQTPEQQMAHQAKRDWVRAKLRWESGAVIGDKEADEEIATYFPVPGDSPAVKEQKRRSRLQAHEQMRSGAGRALRADVADAYDQHETPAPAPQAQAPWRVTGKRDDPVPVRNRREAESLPTGVWFKTPRGEVLQRK